MTSVIHYKFQSAKDWCMLNFDGSVVSVGDAKKAIIIDKRLMNQKRNVCEFDLKFTDASNGHLYEKESELINKNTRLLVKRTPQVQYNPIVIPLEHAKKDEAEIKPTSPLSSNENHNPNSGDRDQTSKLPVEKKVFTCYQCNRVGHTARYCRYSSQQSRQYEQYLNQSKQAPAARSSMKRNEYQPAYATAAQYQQVDPVVWNNYCMQYMAQHMMMQQIHQSATQVDSKDNESERPTKRSRTPPTTMIASSTV